MQNGCIGIFDSGIGGVSVLFEIVKAFPKNKFIYFGDNENAPYGNKSKRELMWLAFNGIMRLCYFQPDVIVIACNTISINCLFELNKLFDVKLIGIFPPVEREIIKNKKVLLLSTVKTAEKFKHAQLLNLEVIGLKTLVQKIENEVSDLSKVEIENNIKQYFYKFHYIILGCTHYIFVKNSIIDHFCPQVLISGIEDTLSQLNCLSLNNKNVKKVNKNLIFFINDKKNINKNIYNYLLNNTN